MGIQSQAQETMSSTQNTEQLTQYLRNTSLFNQVDEASCAKIAEAMEMQIFAKGDTIFHQGEEADSLFIILMGKVSVLLEDPEMGIEQELGELGELDVFGEMSILLNEPRTASIRAAAETACAILGQEAFRRIVVALPQVGLGVSKSLAVRLSERSKQIGFRFVQLNEEEFDPEVYRIIPAPVLEKHKMIPLILSEDSLQVAMTRPYESAAYIAARAAAPGLKLRPVACSLEEYERFMKSVVKPAMEVEPIYPQSMDRAISTPRPKLEYLNRLAATLPDDGVAKLEGAEVIRHLDEIIADSVERGASDIHIEPSSDSMGVRQRVDGRLRQFHGEFPAALHPPLLNRVKILAEMDISERHQPQDGRICLGVNGHPIDLRVNSIPTQYGEKVVMRVLDPEKIKIPLSKLILSDIVAAKVHEAIMRPVGGVVVAGPTGSGKTTTLYSALHERIEVSDDQNIVTVEDPIEYHLKGVIQTQVGDRPGVGFPEMLRALLRQDPDVILIGETRDTVTARIALEAAITGHLVLTTVHAEGAVEAAGRFVEMGCTPYLVATALDLVLAQRLLRRVCPGCKSETTYHESVRQGLARARILEMDESAVLYKGAGCKRCNGTGFQGRVGAYEMLRMNKEIRQALSDGRSAIEIQAIAVETKVLSSFQKYSAFLLRNGLTIPAEILRHFHTE